MRVIGGSQVTAAGLCRIRTGFPIIPVDWGTSAVPPSPSLASGGPGAQSAGRLPRSVKVARHEDTGHCRRHRR